MWGYCELSPVGRDDPPGAGCSYHMTLFCIHSTVKPFAVHIHFIKRTENTAFKKPRPTELKLLTEQNVSDCWSAGSTVDTCRSTLVSANTYSCRHRSSAKVLHL